MYLIYSTKVCNLSTVPTTMTILAVSTYRHPFVERAELGQLDEGGLVGGHPDPHAQHGRPDDLKDFTTCCGYMDPDGYYIITWIGINPLVPRPRVHKIKFRQLALTDFCWSNLQRNE